jgi:large subunit ribosomal protein L15
MLQAHTLKPAKGARHSVKKRGRGNASGHGNYSGHGGKGQTARSGGSRGLRLKGFKRLMQSAPKLRGFTSFKNRPAEVYLRDLDTKFQSGDIINLKVLIEKSLVPPRVRSAKILNSGDITKKLIISGIGCTKGAAEKIKAAGGEVK